MLDIRTLRDNPEATKSRLALRGGSHADLVDAALACDEIRRKAETAKQQLQASRKSLSKQIGAHKARGEDSSQGEQEVRGINDGIAALDRQAEDAAVRQSQILLEMPNLPHEDCPHGNDAEANPVVRSWGEKPGIENPRDHVEIADSLGLIGWDDAIRIAGAGFAVYRKQGARLVRALINFLLDEQTASGYEEVAVPILVKRECMEGTGQLPKFEDDMYGTEPEEGRNSLFLAPTAEVPLTNLFRESLLALDQLPLKLVACTPCFRREAGSAGKVNKGIIRMHQFDKVELVQIVHPDHGLQALEALTADAEAVLQKLGLHYRVLELCAGDLGQSAAKTYDLEVWSPGQNAFLEVSSCSWFGDYQARRMKLRFKDAEGKNRNPHTLNGSGTALPRLLVALLEQGQQPDGSVQLPPPLHSYFGSPCITQG